MSFLGLFLFSLTLVFLFAEELTKVLRSVGLLPPPVVRFDGLLEELYDLWPLEHDEQSEVGDLSLRRAEIFEFRRLA